MVVAISRLIKVFFTFSTVLVLAGCCSLYRPDLRQGNHITQEELNKLEPGMAKVQVEQILGTPAVIPVLEIETWNYTYAFQPGTERGQRLCFETITLYFKGDRLQAYTSNFWHPENLPSR